MADNATDMKGPGCEQLKSTCDTLEALYSSDVAGKQF